MTTLCTCHSVGSLSDTPSQTPSRSKLSSQVPRGARPGGGPAPPAAPAAPTVPSLSGLFLPTQPSQPSPQPLPPPHSISVSLPSALSPGVAQGGHVGSQWGEEQDRDRGWWGQEAWAGCSGWSPRTSFQSQLCPSHGVTCTGPRPPRSPHRSEGLSDPPSGGVLWTLFTFRKGRGWRGGEGQGPELVWAGEGPEAPWASAGT